jgi:hypothetical protein
MLLEAVLIDALHAALEDRIVGFNRVRLDVDTRPFKGRMVDRVVGFVLPKRSWASFSEYSLDVEGSRETVIDDSQSRVGGPV